VTTYPNPPVKDKYLALHESLFTPEELAAADAASDEEATAAIRSMGPILGTFTTEQKQHLDMICTMGRSPYIKKQSRRQKKSARRGK
jgi:hypothetical protein